MPRPNRSSSSGSRGRNTRNSSAPKKSAKKAPGTSRSKSADYPGKGRSSYGSARPESPRRRSSAGDSSASSERKPFKKGTTSGRSSAGQKSYGKKESSPRGSARDDFRKRKFDRTESTDNYPPKRFSDRTGKSKDRFDKDPGKPKGRFDKDSGRSKARFEKDPYESPSTAKRGGKVLRGRNKSAQAEAPVQTEKIRLNRYIANSGVCSRREADELISMGVISVNGKVVTELGYKVNPGDEVRYDKKLLKAEKPVYILMNKPKGFLTTTNDPQERNTVMHLIGSKVKERIYPVGRLDRNTTGLLLLTNDGDLADKLMHPSYNVKKIYKVELDRPLTRADFQKILDGIQLEEGKAQVDDLAIVSDDGKTIGIELHIGWNRVVRRIFESLEYEVVKLDRSVYAGLDKKDLPRGEWRFLSREEIVRLKHFK